MGEVSAYQLKGGNIAQAKWSELIPQIEINGRCREGCNFCSTSCSTVLPTINCPAKRSRPLILLKLQLALYQ
jgi:hypothetical protein